MYCLLGFKPWSIIFRIILNDLQHVTKFLSSTMFAQDTNIFYSNGKINELFENVNNELGNVTNWYVGNNLSISSSKLNSKTNALE